MGGWVGDTRSYAGISIMQPTGPAGVVSLPPWWSWHLAGCFGVCTQQTSKQLGAGGVTCIWVVPRRHSSACVVCCLQLFPEPEEDDDDGDVDMEEEEEEQDMGGEEEGSAADG